MFSFSFVTTLKAQNENRIVSSSFDFSIEYLKPITFGSNSIHDAHKSNGGYGLEMHCEIHKGIKLGLGINFAGYSVTNPELVGNYTRTNYNSFFYTVNYNIALSKKFGIVPQASMGLSSYKGLKNGDRYGIQRGTEYRIGIRTIYNLSSGFGVFQNLNYVYNDLKMSANPGIVNFYNQSHAINFGFGIIFF